MTIKEAQALLRTYGITIRKTDAGDFRVAFSGRGNEDSAAYETDVQAAVDTGLAMSRVRAAIEFNRSVRYEA